MSNTRINKQQLADEALYETVNQIADEIDLEASSKISNCITKIPQDIKLELSSEGVLTLKAGSKYYVPKGVNTYETVVVQNDITRSGGTTNPDEAMAAFIDKDTIRLRYLSTWQSGPQVVSPVSSTTWWDTTTNAIRFYDSSGMIDRYGSLPLAIISCDSTGKIISIDQIFNGFGFMGSTVYMLPGVEMSAPDGKNEYGKNNNLKWTSDRAISYTRTINGGPFIGLVVSNAHNFDNGFTSFVVSEDKPTTNYTLWYKPSENILYTVVGGVATKRVGVVIWNEERDRTSPYKVTSMKVKSPVQLVKYDEFSDLSNKVTELDSSVVKTTGNQTIDGDKTFTSIIVKTYSSSSNSGRFLQMNNPASSTVSTSANYSYYITEQFSDKKAGSCIEFAHVSSDANGVFLRPSIYNGDTRVFGALGIYALKTGAFSTSAPTPTDDTTGSVQIDTVGARNTKLANYVDLNGPQTITGTKTFTKPVYLNGNITYTSASSGGPAFLANLREGSTAGFKGYVSESGSAGLNFQLYNKTNNTFTSFEILNSGETGKAGFVRFPHPQEDTLSSTQGDTVGARNTKLKEYASLSANNAFKSNNNTIYSVATNYTKGTVPSATVGNQYLMVDSTENTSTGRLARFGCEYNTNGELVASMRAYTPTLGSTSNGVISIVATPSGDFYAFAPTPPSTSTTNHIATTEWVNSKMSSEVHCVTRTYVSSDGLSGYRIYDDNYCEQWGDTSFSSTVQTLTFVKKFKWVPQVYLTRVTTRAGASHDIELYANSISVTGFTHKEYTADLKRLMWRAYGYLADGQ